MLFSLKMNNVPEKYINFKDGISNRRYFVQKFTLIQTKFRLPSPSWFIYCWILIIGGSTLAVFKLMFFCICLFSFLKSFFQPGIGTVKIWDLIQIIYPSIIQMNFEDYETYSSFKSQSLWDQISSRILKMHPSVTYVKLCLHRRKIIWVTNLSKGEDNQWKNKFHRNVEVVL